MAKSKSLPDHVVSVAAYSELEKYAGAFAGGHLNLLILCGAPGLGKSQSLRRALSGKVCWIDGNASAYGIYLQAHEHRNLPIVLDDVDGLYRDRQGIRLLKALCRERVEQWPQFLRRPAWRAQDHSLRRALGQAKEGPGLLLGGEGGCAVQRRPGPDCPAQHKALHRRRSASCRSDCHPFECGRPMSRRFGWQR